MLSGDIKWGTLSKNGSIKTFQENRNCVSVFKDFGSLTDNGIFFQALPSFFLNNENCYLTHTLALHLFRLLSMR